MSGSVPGGGAKAEPNLTPILDMVFQLITFFMLVMNFKAAELDLSLRLPIIGSAKPLPDGDHKLVVLNVQLCTKCPHPGCDGLATLHPVIDEGSNKPIGYRLICEHGHGDGPSDHVYSTSDFPQGVIPNGKTCLSAAGHLYCKERRGKDNLPNIDDYLTQEGDLSLMAASMTRDEMIKEGKELPDTVVIRADSGCRFGAVNYVIQECQKQGYRTFALKTAAVEVRPNRPEPAP
jgi:biopolymer transport protein ExbD